MSKSKIFRRIVSFVIALSMMITLINFSTISVCAFDTDYINEDGMDLGYSIINGYSKLSVKNGYTTFEKSAVYSGLDISSPYIIAVAGLFYITNGVNLDKVFTDNTYAISTISKLNSFLSAMGVKNERAKALKTELEKSDAKITSSFDTAGIFIIETDSDYALNLMNNEDVDFVLAGGEVPKSMKDLNFDGKSDYSDSLLIQQYLAKILKFDDRDEDAYIQFACDINQDKEINILDASYLQK